MPIDLHARTNGDDGVVGPRILESRRNRDFGRLFFCLHLSLHVNIVVV